MSYEDITAAKIGGLANGEMKQVSAAGKDF